VKLIQLNLWSTLGHNNITTDTAEISK